MAHFDKAILMWPLGRREVRAALVRGNWPESGDLVAVTPPLSEQQVIGGRNAEWPGYHVDDVEILEAERTIWRQISTITALGGDSEDLFTRQSRLPRAEVRVTFRRSDASPEWLQAAIALAFDETPVPELVGPFLVNMFVHKHDDGYYYRDQADDLITWAATLPGQHPLRIETTGRYS